MQSFHFLKSHLLKIYMDYIQGCEIVLGQI